MKHITIELKHTPTEPSPMYLGIAVGLNSFHFPGCTLPAWDRSYIWICKVDGKIAGFATLRQVWGEKYGYLERVAVLKEFRGNGIQKSFIDIRMRYAKRLGWKGVLTYTTADNYPSINSLMHRGFSIYSPEYAWSGREMLYFKKEF